MSVAFIEGSQPKRRNPQPLIDPVHKIILFWMHRCGSTTAQLWFFQAAGWKERMIGRGASQIMPEWLAEHEHVYSDLDRYYRDPSFLKIAVVRNPLHRAVSTFSVVTDSLSGSQWRAVSRSIADPDPERRLTFHEFIDFLENDNLATANYHWRLQTAQDWYDLALPGVQLVRVEALQDDLDRMCDLLDQPRIKMKQSSATTKVHDELRDVDVASLTRADFLRMFGRDRRGVIQFPDYSLFLAPQTVDRLSRLYEPDMRAFGYSGV